LTTPIAAVTMTAVNGRGILSRWLFLLHEDEHLVIVNKPAGMLAHSPRPDTVWGVADALAALGIGPAGAKLHCCTMVEKYTSGVVVLAKTTDAAQRYAELVANDRVKRRFLACVKGIVKSPAAASGGRSGSHPSKPKPVRAAGRHDVSVRLVVQRPRRAIVTCQSTTGSTRRVRAALHAQRLPIVGDPQFDPRRDGKWSGRLYLHTSCVEFAHPITNKRLRITAPDPESFQPVVDELARLDDQLDEGLVGRMALVFDENTDCFRVFDGKADGLSGFALDVYGEVAVLEITVGKFQLDDAAIRAAAKWCSSMLGVRAVFVKRIPRDRSRVARTGGGSVVTRLVSGSAGEEDTAVREDGQTFLIRPDDGFGVGLFLEHRENRRLIRSVAKGRRVLNLFSYTCGFSIAASVGGAESSVNVDVSKKALEWGKRHFAANDIDLDDHRFFCSDVWDYYKRGERQGHRFDLIVLDPPTFSRTKRPARVMRVERDLTALVAGALKLLNAGGLMLVTVNSAQLSAAWVRERITEAAGRRQHRFRRSAITPEDFTGAGQEAKGSLVEFPT